MGCSQNMFLSKTVFKPIWSEWGHRGAEAPLSFTGTTLSSSSPIILYDSTIVVYNLNRSNESPEKENQSGLGGPTFFYPYFSLLRGSPKIPTN
jgi:hypothetical protein